MLTLADVSRSFGPRTLFEDVSVFISRQDLLGLVGPNGAGKTTLFNLIIGTEPPDSGTITWEKGSTFGYLPQETAPAGDESVLDLATAITPEFVDLRERLRALEKGGSSACMPTMRPSPGPAGGPGVPELRGDRGRQVEDALIARRRHLCGCSRRCSPSPR